MRSCSLSRRLRTLGATLAACATLALFVPAGAGEAKRSPENKRGQFVSVRDFGAIGDGVADDTAAIQAALDAAKGADGTGAGRSVFSLYFPSVAGGFYKVTDTLVIDGTHGLVIYGDGALTERGEASAENSFLRISSLYAAVSRRCASGVRP